MTPEDRAAITTLYADYTENEHCKIYRNEEFIYREYTIMQPLQRSYAITEDRIENMLIKGSLSGVYDEGKVAELENYLAHRGGGCHCEANLGRKRHHHYSRSGVNGRCGTSS